MPTEKYGHIFLGVDYASPPHELLRSALADASNIVPDERGLPKGRGGSSKLSSTSLANAITSFHEFKSGSTTYKLCSYSTKIAYYASGTGLFTDSNTGLTSGKMFQWVNFAGKAIGVNEGSDNPQYWSATDTYGDLAGSPTKGLCIAEWSNRVWLGGNSTDVALLTASHLNDPTTWTTGTATQGVSQTVGDSKDPITGLFGYFDLLLVGKRNNIYKVYGSPATDALTLSIEPIYSKSTDNIGFTSQWAITQVGNDVIFLDGYDIKRLSGIQQYGDVEYTSIIPHLGGYLKDIADPDYIKYTHFFHYKKEQQIWVSIPTGASTRYVFVLDYKFKNETGRYAFYPMGNLVVNCFGGVESGSTTNMYYGDRTGYVRLLDTGNNDDSSAISRYLVTMISGNDIKEGVIDRHEYRKDFINTEAFFKSEQATLTMTPYYALNLMDSAQVRTSGNYTSLGAETVSSWSGTGIYTKRIPLRGLSGNTLAIKWLHNATDQNFTLYPSTVLFNYKSKNRIT